MDHGARSGAEHPLADEARELLSAPGRPQRDDRNGVDYDQVGQIDLDCLIGLGVPRYADSYLCSPVAFMRELMAAVLGWGVEPARLHREVFGPEPCEDAPDPHQPTGPPGDGAEVSVSPLR